MNFAKKILEPLASINLARYHHGICYYDNSIYIAGGISGDEVNHYMNQCERYDIQ